MSAIPDDLDAIRGRARSFAITRTAVKASMGTSVAGDAADVASDVWQVEVERLRADVDILTKHVIELEEIRAEAVGLAEVGPTIPDELVQAAAAAIRSRMLDMVPDPSFIPEGRCEAYARDALQAAFAKLPECEEVRGAVVAAGLGGQERPRLCLLHGQPLGPAPATNCAECRAAIDRTIQEFGDKK